MGVRLGPNRSTERRLPHWRRDARENIDRELPDQRLGASHWATSLSRRIRSPALSGGRMAASNGLPDSIRGLSSAANAYSTVSRWPVTRSKTVQFLATRRATQRY